MNEPIEEEKTLGSGSYCNMKTLSSGEIQIKSFEPFQNEDRLAKHCEPFKTSSFGADTLSVNTANQNLRDKNSIP